MPDGSDFTAAHARSLTVDCSLWALICRQTTPCTAVLLWLWLCAFVTEDTSEQIAFCWPRTECQCAGVVLAAVTFLGEHLTYINCIGLVVLVLGVALFNYTKYKKVITGQAVSTRAPVDYEKGEVKAERHEAHNSERALLVGGRRINLGGTPLASLSAGAASCASEQTGLTRLSSVRPSELTSMQHCWPAWLARSLMVCARFRAHKVLSVQKPYLHAQGVYV